MSGPHRLRGAVMAFPLLLAIACVKAPIDRYYTLSGPPSAQPPAGSASLELDVKVRSLHADEIYRQERIVRRIGPREVSYYDTHRWAAPLDRMVTERAVAVLARELPVRSVIPWTSPREAEVVVEGDILAFEEAVEEGRSVGRVLLEARALSTGTDAVLWSGRVGGSCPTGGAGAARTADALALCLERALVDLAERLAPALPRPEGG